MPSDPAPEAWLARAERDGTTLQEALARFDSLPPVSTDTLRGYWLGGGLHTGHRLDGMLEAFGWWGKAFRDTETVDPLLFRAGSEVIAIDPHHLPLGLAGRFQLQHRRFAVAAFRLAKKALATKRPHARLRDVHYRGVTTAAMLYDRQPIVDFFREIAPGVLLGLMDLRGSAPMFFTLRRTERPNGLRLEH